MSNQASRSNSKHENKAAIMRRAHEPAAKPDVEAVAQDSAQAALRRVAAHPTRARPSDVLALQRTAGNRFVQRLIQAKLTVGPAGDAYEQEADRVADQVMSMSAPASQGPVQRQEEGQEEEEAGDLQAKSLLQRQEEEQEEGEAGDLQTKPIRTDAGEGFETSDDFEGRLHAAKGSGSSLPDDTRTFMESRFEADFSGVRVHTDSEAAQLNREVSAQAFTHGPDIFLGEGKYSLSSSDGQRLLAHELTHVVQQTGARAQPQTKPLQRQEGEGEQPAGGDGAKAPQEITIPDGEVEREGEEAMGHGPCDCLACAPSLLQRSPEAVKTDGTHKPAPTEYKISVGNIGVEVNNSGSTTASSHAHGDPRISVGTITHEFTNPGTLAVSPFGQEDFHCSHKDAKATITGDSAKLDFTLALYCPWGVAGGGNTDVSSGTDAVVTKAAHASGKKVYEQIAEDLRPVAADNWRPKRTYYWSKNLTERHEKYHSTMDEAWGKGAGKTVVVNSMNGKTVSAANTAADVKTHLDAAMTKMSTANWDWYSGGGKDYINRPGEKAAFLEGKDAYIALVDAVKVQGAKLEAAP